MKPFILALALFLGAAVATENSEAGTLTTVFDFSNKTGVQGPTGQLVYQNGEIFGTTAGSTGNGSVYKFDPVSHTLSPLYIFKAGLDGQSPAGLVYHAGILYGATYAGGNSGCVAHSGCGTIFALDLSTNLETVLYRFPDPNTGNSPNPGGLVYHNGFLYGTAEFGGASGAGSVFAINLQSGAETDIFSFPSDGQEGDAPLATLLYINGMLYGVNGYGGCDRQACGSIFSVDPTTGAETTLYTFALGVGGHHPTSNLVEHNGLIYGSTTYGGDLSCGRDGCGVVYSINPATGAYSVVAAAHTKHQLVIALAAHKNNLYETVAPPPTRQLDPMNQGQLAKLNLKTGERTTLYQFDQGLDGANGAYPAAPLVFAHGVFYGSTLYGGESGGDCGRYSCGTLFQYVP